jgi:hypothetical protein
MRSGSFQAMICQAAQDVECGFERSGHGEII